jgi:hypothetical protein
MSPLDTSQTPVVRKNLLGTLIVLGFTAFVIWGLIADLRRVFWFSRVQGTVTAFTPPDKAAAKVLVNGRIEYCYEFHGKSYHGSYPMKGEQINVAARRLLELPHNVDEEIEVAVDPAWPSVSTVDPMINPGWFGVLIFLSPCLYFGVFCGENDVEQSNGAFFVAFLLLTMLGTAGVMFSLEHVPWQLLDAIGVVALVAIPLLARAIASQFGLRRAYHGRSVFVRATREDRTKFVFVLILSIVWWVAIAAMGYQAAYIKQESDDIQRRFQTTQGRIVVSGTKDHPGSRDGNKRIVYEFHLDDTTYKGDRLSILPERITQAKLDKYTVGREVTIHFDPADPNQSILESELPSSFWTLSVFLAAFIPLGFILVRAVFKLAGSEGMRVLRRRKRQ